MSLIILNDGWKRFGEGRIWRCKSPDFICETDRADNVVSYIKDKSVTGKFSHIQSFYLGKANMGVLDANGNGVDILTANSMTESFGTVPTPFDYKELEVVLKQQTFKDQGLRLGAVVDYILQRSKWLVRKEPGYVDPVSTPGRISMGAHHVLLSTALQMQGFSNLSSLQKVDKLTELVLRLPSESLFAAELAIKYFNRSQAVHQNEPPLLAAIYNAGSLRPDAKNAWNLRQYGNHLDRWVSFYNTSRLMRIPKPTVVQPIVKPVELKEKALELKVVRKEFTDKSTIGELYIDEQLHCYTLEDKVRDHGIKVYGETAIPDGRYEVDITFSSRFKRDMPLLKNVPGFDGVRIHSGNTAADTLGCLLVGKNKAEDRIWDCKPVYESLFNVIKSTRANGKCFITILNNK